ncbi:hypothetical protein [uncultured Erythrobacter sp.]|uniref:hypothetical protein n=1 Tax=uncultured Erythrobacter sp. TaxID=263913 RepID=UPI00260D783E|nr:hypothetical protein [uncultured Erythrobacter sp.]
MTAQTYRFTWQDIEIEAVYAPNKWNVIAHLEIWSINPDRAPLPITETGYFSHYHPIEELGGDVVVQVIAWLDEEAAKPAWKACVEAIRQYSLI